MPKRIVEAYAKGRLIADVMVSLDGRGPLTREFDFINAAKEMLTHLSADDADQWVVREPDGDEHDEREDKK